MDEQHVQKMTHEVTQLHQIPPLHYIPMSISTFKYSHIRVDGLEHRLRQIRVSKKTTIWDDIDKAYVVSLLIRFRMLDVEGFIRWYR